MTRPGRTAARAAALFGLLALLAIPADVALAQYAKSVRRVAANDPIVPWTDPSTRVT